MNKKKTTWLALLCSMSLIGASCTKTGTPVSSADSKTSTLPTSSSSSSVVTKAAITYSTGEGYTLTGPASVDVGSDLTFTLAYEEGYAGGSVSASSGTLIDNKDGTYSIAGVTGDLTISVSGVSKITLSITYPTGDHFTLTGEKSVAFGSSYTFKVVFEAGYSGIVKVNGETVTLASDGSYMIPVVKANVLITVEGVDIATYPVSLPTGEGYTLTADKEVVKYGESLTLTFKVLASYSGGVVKVNGTALSFDSNGQATITNIVAPLTITVEGLIKTITLDYVSGTGYHFTGPATANLGDSVTFNVVYDAGYSGGTVMAGNTVLSANTDGSYTIASIAEATRTITLVDVYETITDCVADFPNAGTQSVETVVVNTAGGYAKSTKLVVKGEDGFTHSNAFRFAPLAKYKEVRFSVYADGAHWWMVKPWGDDPYYVCSNEAKWHEVELKLEDGAFHIYFDGTAKNETLDVESNMMDFYMNVSSSTGAIFYFSELQGILNDVEYTSPYKVIAESPLASGVGTEDTKVLPPFAPATKTYKGTYLWQASDRACADIDLTLYKEILYYVRDDSQTGNGWTSLRKGTTDLSGINALALNVWAPVRLVLKNSSTNTWSVLSNNYAGSDVVATNFNQFVYALNDEYHFSQIFGITR